CPHCKRPVVALREQQRARCAEHGIVVPMRSVVANAPVPPPLQQQPTPVT
ncbi:MAG: hypothetical protein IT490_11100, partial [Candidatus Contendobacter sp.]|nr:hypothetical protein [Candidatus Contendobacter sp.]